MCKKNPRQGWDAAFEKAAHEEYLDELEDAVNKLMPNVAPQTVDSEIFLTIKPESLELFDGNILADSEEGTIALVKILITNLGLTKVLTLAPVPEWEKAISVQKAK